MNVNEVYTSLQCEGSGVGYPIQFVRFAGCNLRCPGWPCDTDHAVIPELWMKDHFKATPEELFNRLDTDVKNICLTGGEPFLQKDVELQEFVEMCIAAGYRVECFTNGTIKFPDWAHRSMVFMMDFKLPGSGEWDLRERLTGAREENILRLRRTDGIKFVAVDRKDLNTAVDVYEQYKDLTEAQFWVAPAWSRIEPVEIVDFILDNKLPWRLNLQIHKYIWEADERGV